MTLVYDALAREEARREEWEDREYAAEIAEKKRQHELRLLKSKLKLTTRSKTVVKIVSSICSILPKTVVVFGIVCLLLANRPVPNSLYDYLAS